MCGPWPLKMITFFDYMSSVYQLSASNESNFYHLSLLFCSMTNHNHVSLKHSIQHPKHSSIVDLESVQGRKIPLKFSLFLLGSTFPWKSSWTFPLLLILIFSSLLVFLEKDINVCRSQEEQILWNIISWRKNLCNVNYCILLLLLLLRLLVFLEEDIKIRLKIVTE